MQAVWYYIQALIFAEPFFGGFIVNNEADSPLSFYEYECLKTKKEENLMNAVEQLAASCLKEDAPKVQIGDTVKVHVKIREGEKSRIQLFEGTVIAKNNSGISETFTVRRVSYGVGVERVFPVHSPSVDKVEVVRKGKVRRSKLYYIRQRLGKAAKVKEKI